MYGLASIGLLLLCAQDDPGTSAQDAPAPAAEQEVLRLERWLTLDKVDEGGRIPVSPDQVFLRHLIDSASPHPVAGEEVIGIFATHSWKSATPGDDGNVPVPRGGWAYGTIDVPEDGVWLARLAGAIRIHINGEAFVGDLYRYGFGGVPVFLKKGQNHLYIAGARGSFSLDFVAVPKEGLLPVDWDALAPTSNAPVHRVRASRKAFGYDASRLVLNCTLQAVPVATSLWSSGNGMGETGVDGGFAPLGVRRVSMSTFGAGNPVVAWHVIPALLGHDGTSGSFISAFEATREETEPWNRWEISAPAGGAAYLSTFRSGIDGSIQSYGVVPVTSSSEDAIGLVLSLHGASVQAISQASAYQPKEDILIVAPTNRRPFGFDWQDWGRVDAYEVLEEVSRWAEIDPDRVHLTGHSMGGHGTWHLGVNDPDHWASIAPSAGWSSFDSYGGRPIGALDAIWRAADWTSQTLDLLPNLRGVPVSVLHGDADDNVPASEARTMVEALKELGVRHQVHFEPDAGHWWENRCVDWPGFFAMFREVKRRSSAEVRSFDWRSAGPAVDSRHYWFEALQRIDSGQPIRVRAQVREVDGYLRIEIVTENVRSFRLHPEFEADVLEVAVDGHLEWADLGEGALPKNATFRRYAWEGSPRQQGAGGLGGARGALGGNQERDYWVRLDDTTVPPGQKSPDRDGPFKRAFDNRFILVFGTAGDSARDAALLARARHDSGQWWYRANGDCPAISDEAFLEDQANEEGRSLYFGRNVILYGNSQSNSAWSALVPDDCPLVVDDYSIVLGEKMWQGENGLALAVYPRKDSDTALVGIIAETGLKGARLGDALKYFVSGTGYPDYLIISSKVLAEGDGAVDAAGFFDYAWQLPK